MVTSATHHGAAKAGMKAGIKAGVAPAAMVSPHEDYDCNASSLP
ncbi:hypothetical protein [Bradyrhizobium sp. OK095]|jgi:hypothetical protein|nr:hypothetical protein [Bradyrhizobium sp. OK095]